MVMLGGRSSVLCHSSSSDQTETGVYSMTKYLVWWQVNPHMIPADPEQRVKLWVSLLEKVKADVDARG
jgi:hypothetical protein